MHINANNTFRAALFIERSIGICSAVALCMAGHYANLSRIFQKVCPVSEGRAPCALFDENHVRDMNKLDSDLNFCCNVIEMSRCSMKKI